MISRYGSLPATWGPRPQAGARGYDVREPLPTPLSFLTLIRYRLHYRSGDTRYVTEMVRNVPKRSETMLKQKRSEMFPNGTFQIHFVAFRSSLRRALSFRIWLWKRLGDYSSKMK